MLLKCTHCYRSIVMDKNVGHRGKGLGVQIQCPHCQAWLGRNAMLSGLKLLGFYGAVTALVMGYGLDFYPKIMLMIAIFSGIALGMGHMMDHLIVKDAPLNNESLETQDREQK
jgi:hypothetical protein